MKKYFKTLILPAFTALLLCGCGESGEVSPSGISMYTGISAFTDEDGTNKTTALTTCTTLKPFAEITAMTKMSFAYMTTIDIQDKISKGELIPWNGEKRTFQTENNTNENTENVSSETTERE